MRTRDYYTPENADQLDSWREAAPEGTERRSFVTVSSVAGYPVSVSLHEEGAGGDRNYGGFGRDFAAALDVALRRFAGEEIDMFGSPVDELAATDNERDERGAAE